MKKLFTSLLLAIALTGCAQFGLQAPKSFDEQLAYSYGTVASLRASTATALASGAIKVSDAVEVQSLADKARALLDSARMVEKTDISTATGKLQLATAILTQLQTYTATRGIK